jgi:hypothetical protein
VALVLVRVLLSVAAPLSALGAQRPIPVDAVPAGIAITADQQLRWESNVRFQRANDTADVVSRTTIGLVGVRPLGATTIGLFGHVTAMRYGQLVALNGATWDAGLALQHKFSTRWTASASLSTATMQTIGAGGAASGVTGSDGAAGTPTPPTTGGAGVFLPLAISTLRSATANSAVKLSPRADAALSLSYSSVHFDAPGFINGSTSGIRASVTERLTEHDRLGVEGEVRQQLLGPATYYVSRLSITEDATQSWGAWRLAAGASNVAGGSDSTGGRGRVTPTLSAQVRIPFGDARVLLGADRSIQQAFGLGTLFESSNFEGGMDYTIVPTMTVRVTGSFGSNVALTGPTAPQTSRSLLIELQSRPVTGLEVVWQAFDRARDNGTLIATRGTALQVRLAAGR